VEGRLLDIGCGFNELVRRHGKGVGVDVHPWEGVNVLIDDAAHLPFADASFDTVTIVAALNHIPNREAALAEARRVLAPGGRLILTMIPPGIARVWHALRRPWDADQTERGMVKGERYGLTRREVRLLLADQGFILRHEKPFMLGINRLTVAQKPASRTF
jgi:SAM-dependent methyltransferase